MNIIQSITIGNGRVDIMLSRVQPFIYLWRLLIEFKSKVLASSTFTLVIWAGFKWIVSYLQSMKGFCGCAKVWCWKGAIESMSGTWLRILSPDEVYIPCGTPIKEVMGLWPKSRLQQPFHPFYAIDTRKEPKDILEKLWLYCNSSTRI